MLNHKIRAEKIKRRKRIASELNERTEGNSAICKEKHEERSLKSEAEMRECQNERTFHRSVVKDLMDWKPRKPAEVWVEDTINLLVKELKCMKNKTALMKLELALRCPNEESMCITIQPSVSARLTCHWKRHVVLVCCRVWRWPDVEVLMELEPLSCCQYSFESTKNKICINPYHIRRKDETEVIRNRKMRAQRRKGKRGLEKLVKSNDAPTTCTTVGEPNESEVENSSYEVYLDMDTSQISERDQVDSNTKLDVADEVSSSFNDNLVTFVKAEPDQGTSEENITEFPSDSTAGQPQCDQLNDTVRKISYEVTCYTTLVKTKPCNSMEPESWRTPVENVTFQFPVIHVKQENRSLVDSTNRSLVTSLNYKADKSPFLSYSSVQNLPSKVNVSLKPPVPLLPDESRYIWKCGYCSHWESTRADISVHVKTVHSKPHSSVLYLREKLPELCKQGLLKWTSKTEDGR